jgi:hypothetical protein
VRRLLLLAAFLAAPSAFAQTRSAPAFVQLSFNFAPSPALTAPLTVPSLAPLASLQAPALQPSIIAPAPAPVMAAVAAGETAIEAIVPKGKPVARATAIDYEEFGRRLAGSPGLSLDPFKHAEAKRRILKAAGYSRLYGAGGVPIPIDQAADVRVGRAFANVHRAYRRR